MEISRRKFLQLTVLGSVAAVADACTKKVEPTARSTLAPTRVPINTPEVTVSAEVIKQVKFIKGVDTMKLSKDRLRNPLSFEGKKKIAEMAKGLGVSHVTVDTPYDDPLNLNTFKETKEWVEAIRLYDLQVAHRHMFTKFEGIYDQKKDPTIDYIKAMKTWMINNATLIENDDIWTPMPEPQNGGIKGINCETDCIFGGKDRFNQFIQNIVLASKDTLKQIGKNKVEVVCCGFDLFIGSGNNNSAWEGKSFLDKSTVATLGCPSFDHYPQPDYKTGIRRNYRTDLEQLSNTWPEQCFILTEVGKQEGFQDAESIENMFNDFSVFTKTGLRGVFWWHMDIAGTDEGLLNPDFSPRPSYFAVKNGFEKLPEYVAEK